MNLFVKLSSQHPYWVERLRAGAKFQKTSGVRLPLKKLSRGRNASGIINRILGRKPGMSTGAKVGLGVGAGALGLGGLGAAQAALTGNEMTRMMGDVNFDGNTADYLDGLMGGGGAPASTEFVGPPTAEMSQGPQIGDVFGGSPAQRNNLQFLDDDAGNGLDFMNAYINMGR